MEYTAIIVFVLLICALLIGAVLIQNSKGGGLISQLGSVNQIGGVAQTTDFIEKATWILWALMTILCILSVAFLGGNSSSDSDFSTQSPTEQAAPADMPDAE